MPLPRTRWICGGLIAGMLFSGGGGPSRCFAGEVAPDPAVGAMGLSDMTQGDEHLLNDWVVLRQQQKWNRYQKWKDKLEVTADATAFWNQSNNKQGSPNDGLGQESNSGQGQSSGHGWSEQIGAQFLPVQIYRTNLLRQLVLGGTGYVRSYYASQNGKNKISVYGAPSVTWNGGLDYNRFVWNFSENLGSDLPTPTFDEEDPAFSVNNTAETSVFYKVTRELSAGMAYSNQIIKYLQTTMNQGDSMTNSLTPIIKFEKSTARTRFYVENEYSKTSYTHNSEGNYTSKGIRTGSEYRISSKTSLATSGGYTWTTYDNPGAQGNEGTNGFVYNVSYNQRISPATSWSLTADRSITDELSAAQGITPISTENQAIENGNQLITRTGINASLSQLLGARSMLFLSVGNTWETSNGNSNNNSEGNSDSKLFTASAAFNYSLTSHINIRLTYEFSDTYGNGSGNGSLGNTGIENQFMVSCHYAWGGGTGSTFGQWNWGNRLRTRQGTGALDPWATIPSSQPARYMFPASPELAQSPQSTSGAIPPAGKI